MRLLALALLTGCVRSVPPPDPEALRPHVRLHDVEVEALTFRAITLDLQLDVDNPHRDPLELEDVRWDLSVEERPVLSGTWDDELEVGAGGRERVHVPVTVPYVDLVRTLRAATSDDDVPYALTGSVFFDTAGGPLGVPFRHEGRLPVLRAPSFEVVGARLERLDWMRQRATLVVDLDVTNPQATTVHIRDFDYDVDLSGQPVAAGRVARLSPVAPGRTERLTLPVSIDLLRIGERLTSGQDLELRLRAQMEATTPWGLVPLTIDEQADVSSRSAARGR